MKKRQLYQICCKGYDGSTDETDGLVKWIAAPTIGIAQAYCDKVGWVAEEGSALHEMDPVTDADNPEVAISGGVNVVLGDDGEVLAKFPNDPILIKVGTIVKTVRGAAQGDRDEGVMSNDDTDTIVHRETKPGEYGKITYVEGDHCGVEFMPSEVWVNPTIEELLDPEQYELYPEEKEEE